MAQTIFPGDRFHSLTVIERVGAKQGKSLWLCRCDCGNSSEVITTNLSRGTTRSCGCLVGRKRIAIGQIFGRLTVIERRDLGEAKTKYLCSCSCGNTTITTSGNLNNGTTQSCGCLCRERVSAAKRIHGHGSPGHHSSTYSSWGSMRERCMNPSATGYKNWGGRGISICDRWDDFRNFLADMGERPKGTSLDRIDNSGNYGPHNCRWATPVQQANNRRNTRPR